MTPTVHSVPQLPHDLVVQLRRPAPLEDPRLAATVLAVAGLLLLIMTFRWVIRRRRGRAPSARPLRIASVAGTAALFVVGAALAVNSYAGYIPTVGALADIVRGQPAVGAVSLAGAPPGVAAIGAQAAANGSRVVLLKVGDPALRIPPRAMYVLLPPGYDSPGNAARRYPVVYLIHGHPGGPADWLRAGRVDRTIALLAARRLVGPMIIAMPDANGGWMHDSECLNQPGGPQVATYLTSSVVAAMDQTFRTIPTAAGRAIGGMSSGAYCALNLGLHYQQRFSVILASGPYGDPGVVALNQVLHGNRRAYLANSPSYYIPTMHFSRRMAIMLDASSNDRITRDTATRLARMLALRDQYVALRIAPALGHTWREAQVELPYSLIFAAQHLAGAGPGPGLY